MKSISIIVLSFIICFFVLVGCNTTINDRTEELGDSGPPPEAIELPSLERLQQTSESGGLSHLGFDPSTKLYVPAIIPDGYEIYAILVAERNVSLRYLPNEHTGSQWTIMEAQNNNIHFSLWYALPNEETPNTRAGLLEQFNANDTDFIAGKYLFQRPSSFFWVEEETMFSISLPITMVTPFASALRDESIDGTEILSRDGFSELMSFLRVELLS